MTMTPEAETLARKIDETRKDVKTLHPLMQLLDTEESNPAAEFAARLITLLTEVREEQRALAQVVKAMAENTQTASVSPSIFATLENRMTALESFLGPLPSLIERILEAQIANSQRLDRIEKVIGPMTRFFVETLD